jgi:acyl dehydratase
MKYSDLYFEDFTVGKSFETDSKTISQDDIIRFGESFAPLPYHTDPVAAKDSMFGDLVAVGSPGVDRLRWKKPVKPGETLQVTAIVLEASPAREAGGKNLIKLQIVTTNQDGDAVLEMQTLHFVAARPQ